ncbi:hypothetical protein ACFFX0_03465 [Citricoccus parietis]|uniref:Uncharacterized protein n=1 Tax=Citricoccus parietis TaxID=592307 RepID=A0ABV5FV15_9MICC
MGQLRAPAHRRGRRARRGTGRSVTGLRQTAGGQPVGHRWAARPAGTRLGCGIDRTPAVFKGQNRPSPVITGLHRPSPITLEGNPLHDDHHRTP